MYDGSSTLSHSEFQLPDSHFHAPPDDAQTLGPQIPAVNVDRGRVDIRVFRSRECEVGDFIGCAHAIEQDRLNKLGSSAFCHA